MEFINLFLQDVCLRNLINVLQHSVIKKTSPVDSKLVELRGNVLQREVRENRLVELVAAADLLLTRDKLVKSLEHMQRKLAFVKSMFNLKELGFGERTEVCRSLVRFFQEE